MKKAMSKKAVIDRARETVAWLQTLPEAARLAWYLGDYSTPEQLAQWYAYLRYAIAEQVPGYGGSVGVDFGCAAGIGTCMMSAMGAGRVFGIEVRPASAALARKAADHFGADDVRICENPFGAIPLLSESVDWVFLNQVFCDMTPGRFDPVVAELCRVLRPGGMLIFCDANNPHCPATLQRLEHLFRDREVGDGTAEHPAGVLYRQRRDVIAGLAPDLAPETVERLARDTCYLWGPGLKRAVREYVASGTWPCSPFTGDLDRSPVYPSDGAAIGNITDPFDLMARFESHGLTCRATVTPLERPDDNVRLLEALGGSQGFYIYGIKRDASGRPSSGRSARRVSWCRRMYGWIRRKSLMAAARAVRALRRG